MDYRRWQWLGCRACPRTIVFRLKLKLKSRLVVVTGLVSPSGLHFRVFGTFL